MDRNPSIYAGLTSPIQLLDFLPSAVQDGLGDSFAELQALLDEEYNQLVENHRSPGPSTSHLYPFRPPSHTHYLLIYIKCTRKNELILKATVEKDFKMASRFPNQ
jgi:hypothetical protein